MVFTNHWHSARILEIISELATPYFIYAIMLLRSWYLMLKLLAASNQRRTDASLLNDGTAEYAAPQT